eukprot:507381_1
MYARLQSEEVMAESSAIETCEDPDPESCDVRKCKSVKRLKQILHFMQSLEDQPDQGNNDEIEKSLVEYTDNNQHLDILNDYHHIITNHLTTKDPLQNDQNYQIINEAMTQLITCDIAKCNLYRRNGSDREKEEKNPDKEEDKKGFILMDILDNIHTHLIHSYDTGYRIKSMTYDQDNAAQSGDDGDDLDTNKLCVDATMNSIRNSLDEKRKKLENIRGKDRVHNNKFLTDYQTTNTNKQEEDSKESDDDDDSKDDDHNNSIDFSFGTKFYYWSWYKNNNDEDRIFHPGDPFAKWYIEPTYGNLKAEILNSTTIELFNDTSAKAQYMLGHSQILKQMKCRNGVYDTELSTRYDVAVDTPMTYLHIMSVMFYTDFTKLSYAFSLSFRKKTAKESNKALKQRNAKYWHWAKLLNETVSLFGYRLNYSKEPKISTLYHGVSFMYFNSFVTRFISPTSTTLAIGVATIFASACDNGIILAIEQKGGMEEMFPYYFNCSLVSRFASEDERLFIGGNGDAEYYREGLLEFKSIWLINEQQNLQPFIRALSLFSIVINGQGQIDKKKYRKPVEWYYKIVCGLLKEMKDEKANKCPKYIKACFKKLLDSRQYVKVNLFGMWKYEAFMPMFIDQDMPCLPRIEYICELFGNCTKIVCYMNYIAISKHFMKHLIGILKKIGDDELIKLKEIVFEAYMFHAFKFDLDKCQSMFAKQLNGKWKVNHLELFTGVGCWNGECNGLQIMYQED